MNAKFGLKWHRSQLPQDIAEKFTCAFAIERRVPWLQLVPHHPIYYTDFPDLRKIIARKDNWDKVFCKLFGRNKDLFANMISELEPLRNSVAHNRAISDASVKIIETAMERLRTALGANRFQTFSASSTVFPDVYGVLSSLRQEAEVAAVRMRGCQPGLDLRTWEHTKDQWWFEDAYLGADLAPVCDFFYSRSDTAICHVLWEMAT